VNVLSVLSKDREIQPSRALGLLQWLITVAAITSAFAPRWCVPGGNGAGFILIMMGLMIAFVGYTSFFPRPCDPRPTFREMGFMFQFVLYLCILVFFLCLPIIQILKGQCVSGL